jgi:hypothetical protein
MVLALKGNFRLQLEPFDRQCGCSRNLIFKARCFGAQRSGCGL